ncbi:selenoprotein, putative [Plasmodium vinckei brucechwatti]|uniref:Selenoprotein, putative n=1 Tax=Plasmodium vinckei brucechwatti TaxID=119398 RepID=A0A6V7S6V3_PLAVN|nr:selenoprotein, putative [Plasmodium vinckei brucechwatti]
MDKLKYNVSRMGTTFLTIKNVLFILAIVLFVIVVYKYVKYKNKISEAKRNNEIHEKMKISRERQLQKLEEEMIINKKKMSENLKNTDKEKSNKILDSSTPKPNSKDKSTFSHFKDYSNYYKPSIRDRYKGKAS